LRAHRRAQAELRLLMGGHWAAGDLVCERLGHPIDPDAWSKAFKVIARRAGLAGATRLHDVRHAVATAWLEQGLHPAIASAALGHSSPAFTMGAYQHVLDGMGAQAAEALEAALGFAAAPEVWQKSGIGEVGGTPPPGGRR
ncbi:MAG: tyrosine-type recombinase/integrase, partial [Acidimicrobiia bacterium]